MEYVESQTSPDGTMFYVKVVPHRLLELDESTRLHHALDLTMRGFVRRYAFHVVNWGTMKTALFKLTEEEAKVLGVLHHWRLAQRSMGRSR